MRFLFVSPPHAGFDRNRIPRLTFSISRIPSISGITLAAYVRARGHKCYVIDGNRIAWQFGNVREQTYREIIRQTMKFKPSVIGITMLTADFYEAKTTIEELRRAFPKATIIAGGPHPSGEPDATLRQISALDGVGIGPGEEICLNLAEGKPLSEVDGCVYLDGEEVSVYKKRKIETNIDKFPFPAWDLIDGDYYSELNYQTTFGLLTRSLLVLTSRGCPRRCYFCSSDWNKPLRTHSVHYVLTLCKQLLTAYPIDTIAFWDDTIGIPRRRLVEICEEFINSQLNKTLKWTAQLRADQIDVELLELMKEAGCIKVAFGAESGDDRILKVLNKGTTVDLNYASAEAIHSVGLHLGLSVMLGVPTETEEEMEKTIHFCKHFHYAHIGIGRFSPLPGSPSYYELVESGRINVEEVNWELLGNFSLTEGPYFGAAPSKKFRNILQKAKELVWKQNMENFVRNNRNRYPEIVGLCYRKDGFIKHVLKKVVPSKYRKPLKQMVLGG